MKDWQGVRIEIKTNKHTNKTQKLVFSRAWKIHCLFLSPTLCPGCFLVNDHSHFLRSFPQRLSLSECPSHFPLKQLFLILRVPGQLLPLLWSPSWSAEQPMCLTRLSAPTAIVARLRGMFGVLTSWSPSWSFLSTGLLYSSVPGPNSGSGTGSVNVRWMDGSSSVKRCVFIHSFIPSSLQWTLTEHLLRIKHTKHSLWTGNITVSKADKNGCSHGLPC